ncbi:hypothetical protein QJQ45_008035 [Haematococcus lacustris]|nr:hypothetical protein QJQ45_008035 [Haematococcus lacustris]
MWQRVDLAWADLITGAIGGVLEHNPDGLDPVPPLGAFIAAFLALYANLKPKFAMGHPGPRRRAALAHQKAIRAKVGVVRAAGLSRIGMANGRGDLESLLAYCHMCPRTKHIGETGLLGTVERLHQQLGDAEAHLQQVRADTKQLQAAHRELLGENEALEQLAEERTHAILLLQRDKRRLSLALRNVRRCRPSGPRLTRHQQQLMKIMIRHRHMSLHTHRSTLNSVDVHDFTLQLPKLRTAVRLEEVAAASDPTADAHARVEQPKRRGWSQR